MNLRSILEDVIYEEQSRTVRLNGIYGVKEMFERRDFSEYNLSKTQIFRGMDGGPSFGYIKPSKATRTSAYSKNYYTLIMDGSDKWSEYPDRSKSIICSTSQRAASNYGEVYLVIPENSPDIAVAPARDLWYSFSSQLGELTLSSLEEFNSVLYDLGKAILGKNPPDDSLASFIKFLERLERKGEETGAFDEIIQTSDISFGGREHYSPEVAMFLKKYRDHGQSLVKYIEHLLDPNENAFEIQNYGSPFYLSGNVEVWMSNPAMLIRKDKWDEFFEEIIGMETPFKK